MYRLSAVRTVLRVRKIQIVRIFSQLRWYYWGLLAFSLTVVLAQLLPLFDNPELLAFLQVQSILGIHLSRKDSSFLKMTFPEHYILIKVVEYLLISLPSVSILIFSQAWWAFLVCLLAPFPISFIPNRKREKNRSFLNLLTKWIPQDNFEWRAGVKQNWWLLLLLYLITFVGIYFRLPFIWLLGGLGSLLTITSFYQHFEPAHFISFQNESAEAFFWTKFKKHLWCYCFLNIPLFMVQMIVFPHTIIFCLAFLLIAGINILAFLATKYASYEPQSELSGAYKFLFAWFAIGVVLPIFLPLPIFFVFKNYRRAIKNLEVYL